ncbi:hypothetical protein GQ457_05G016850 [Hibiscus cannabinus]
MFCPPSNVEPSLRLARRVWVESTHPLGPGHNRFGPGSFTGSPVQLQKGGGPPSVVVRHHSPPVNVSFPPFFIPDSPERAKTPRIGIRPYGVGRTKRRRPPSDRLGSEICCSPCLDDPLHRWDSLGNAPVTGNHQGRQWSSLSSDLRYPPLDRLEFGICHSTSISQAPDRWDSPSASPVAGNQHGRREWVSLTPSFFSWFLLSVAWQFGGHVELLAPRVLAGVRGAARTKG